jgi:hypothetical protein
VSGGLKFVESVSKRLSLPAGKRSELRAERRLAAAEFCGRDLIDGRSAAQRGNAVMTRLSRN